MATIHKISVWFSKHFELLCWITALVLFYFLPVSEDKVSLCVFKAMGFGRCPGCGMGHALHYALRGEWSASYQQHPLGIIALLVLLNRIRQLLIQLKTS